MYVYILMAERMIFSMDFRARQDMGKTRTIVCWKLQTVPKNSIDTEPSFQSFALLSLEFMASAKSISSEGDIKPKVDK